MIWRGIRYNWQYFLTLWNFCRSMLLLLTMVMSFITISAFIPIGVNACNTELSHLCCKKLWVTSASSREVIQIRHIGGMQFLSPCLLSMRKIITSVRPSQGWTCSWTCQTQRQIKSETVCWNNYVVFRSAQMQWVQLHEVWHQLWLHEGNTYERFADIDLAAKPLLALTSWCASHPRTESRPYFLFFFWYNWEEKCLSQAEDKHKHISRANRNSPGPVQSAVVHAHVKTQSACHSRWGCQALCLAAPEN